MSLGPLSPTGAPAARGQQAQPGDEKLHGLPAAESRPPLQKIAVVELAGERVHIAKNGGFHIVIPRVDDYGTPTGTAVSLESWLGVDRPIWPPALARIQALLDAYGEALVRLQGQRDLRLGGEGSAE